MATWHITVAASENPIAHVPSSAFNQAVQALRIKPYEQRFRNHGFTVQPMPEESVVALSVSHPLESAITLFMLQYDCAHINIHRIS